MTKIPEQRLSADDVSPRYFTDPGQFRKWLGKNHASARELWVGYHKKSSGKPSMTWPESVDQALCFGWIDGIRKSVDAGGYMIRFTPRRPGSNWSSVNLRRVKELLRLRLMHPAGKKAYERCDTARSRRYSIDRKNASLETSYEAEFRSNILAWKFFQAQTP